MTTSRAPRTLSGYVLSAGGATFPRRAFDAVPSLTEGRTVGDTRWDEYTYRSDIPLRGEEQRGLYGFEYRVLCRQSGPRVLLLSESKQIVDVLLAQAVRPSLALTLRRVRVPVDELVKSLAERPGAFVLSFVHARVPVYGQQLRSISLYGDDVAESTLCRTHLPLMECYACGLRDVVGGGELIRLRGDGVISLAAHGLRNMNLVERALGFVRERGFLREA